MVLTLDLIEFAAEFVETARKCIDEAPGIKRDIFTSRKSQAICSMGIARLLRQGTPLSIPQLANIAVITTPPEAQKYAEMIALRILLDQPDPQSILFFNEFEDTPLNQQPPPPKVRRKIPPQLSAQALLLEEILDFLDLHSSVDPAKDLEILQFIEALEKEMFHKPGATPPNQMDQQQLQQLQQMQQMQQNQQNQQLHQPFFPPQDQSDAFFEAQLQNARKKLAFQLAGGRNGLLDQKISALEDLFQNAEKALLRSVPYMDNEGIIQSSIMGLNDSVTDLSQEQAVQNSLELLNLTQNPDFQAPLQDLKEKMTQNELRNNLNLLTYYESYLDRLNLKDTPLAQNLKPIIEDIKEEFRDKAQLLDDLIDFPDVFKDSLDREKAQEILKNSQEHYSPLEFLQKAKAVDDLLDTNFTSQAFDEFQENFANLELEEILDNFTPVEEWMEMVENRAQNIQNDPDAEWMDRQELRDSLQSAIGDASHPFFEKSLKDLAQKNVTSMLAQTNNADELTDIVQFAREESFSYNASDIRKKGESFDMSMTDIAKLIGSVYEFLKGSLETSDLNYFEMEGYLKSGTMSPKEMQSLAQISIQKERTESLGALAQQNLQMVISQMPKTKAGEEMLEQALGAGGGENLLMQWFQSGIVLPPPFRAIVKAHAKRIMIDLAKARASALIGSSEAGALSEGTTRPYVLGDDPESIDLDETLENILDSGKRLENLSVDDFVVRKEVSGRRCVVFLVDISGSMSGAPLAGASMATAMLLFAFARDELGVALFESNTHVLCEIGEPLDVDELVDEILELKARGGTQMQGAIKWAETQFEKSRSQDRVFIMVTDAMLGDFRQSVEHLKKISDMGTSSALIVPQSCFGFGNIQQLVESANAEIIKITDWKQFPEIVSKVLTRV